MIAFSAFCLWGNKEVGSFMHLTYAHFQVHRSKNFSSTGSFKEALTNIIPAQPGTTSMVTSTMYPLKTSLKPQPIPSSPRDGGGTNNHMGGAGGVTSVPQCELAEWLQKAGIFCSVRYLWPQSRNPPDGTKDSGCNWYDVWDWDRGVCC
jgi:hypothetical protein